MDLHPSGGQFTVNVRRSWPANLVFKVNSFRKLLKRETQEYKSMAFVVGNYKWRLIIRPKKDADTISLFLSLDDELPDGWSVKATCSIILHNQKENNYSYFQGKPQWFDANNSKWGFSISKTKLTEPSKGYLVNDRCVFGAEVLINQIPASDYFYLMDWEISNVSKLKDLWISPEFVAGNLRWKMKLHPKGTACTPGTENVSIYLECVDSMNFASNEQAEAEICVRMKNKLPTAHIFKTTSHCFTSEERVFGFPDFIPITDFRSRSKGFVVNDCCFIEAEISLKNVRYTPN